MRLLAVVGVAIYLIVLFIGMPSFLRSLRTTMSLGWVGNREWPQRVVIVNPLGPAAGILQVGDRVLALDGSSNFSSMRSIWLVASQYEPEVAYRLRVVRGDRTFEAEFRTVGTPPSAGRILLLLSFVAGSICFLTIGLLMAWKRPDLHTARLGWLACQLTAFVYLTFAYPVKMLGFLGFVRPWHIFAAYCFVAAFPYPVPENRAWRGIRWSLFAACAGNWILNCSMHFEALDVFFRQTSFSLQPTFSASLLLGQDGSEFAALAVLVRNYRASSGPADRRKLELVGGVTALTLLVVALASVTQIATKTPNAIALLAIANLAPLAIPFFFCYAVIRHQVMDIRLVIRRGLQYLLARQVLRVLTLLPLAVIAIHAIRNPTAPIGSALNFTGIALMAAAALGLEFRNAILASVDRLFFRETLDREKMVRALLSELAKLASFDEIVNTLRLRLDRIFFPEFVNLVERPAGQSVDLGELDAELAARKAVLRIPFYGPDGRMDGWLALGPKKSEEPYAPPERELLELVASQVGLVRENLQQASMRFEAVLAERARIARELHDTMSQGFAGISLHLEAAHQALAGSPDQAETFLNTARTLAKQSMQEARESVRGLRASGTQLEVRLRALATSPSIRPVVAVELQESVCDTASADASWHLARIAEEAVANAIKHAYAERITVELKSNGNYLVLRVHDNGVGFDPLTIVRKGFGLLGMEERIGQLGGLIEVNSAPGKGTEVLATAPVSVGKASVVTPQ